MDEMGALNGGQGMSPISEPEEIMSWSAPAPSKRPSSLSALKVAAVSPPVHLISSEWMGLRAGFRARPSAPTAPCTGDY